MWMAIALVVDAATETHDVEPVPLAREGRAKALEPSGLPIKLPIKFIVTEQTNPIRNYLLFVACSRDTQSESGGEH